MRSLGWVLLLVLLAPIGPACTAGPPPIPLRSSPLAVRAEEMAGELVAAAH
jgi:hypothetical protein